MITEKDGKKAYSSPSLKKWGSVKELTMNGKTGERAEVGGSFPGDA